MTVRSAREKTVLLKRVFPLLQSLRELVQRYGPAAGYTSRDDQRIELERAEALLEKWKAFIPPRTPKDVLKRFVELTARIGELPFDEAGCPAEVDQLGALAEEAKAMLATKD